MKNLKLYLGIALLVCLLPMPYGYYTLVRILSMIYFGVLAFRYYSEKKEGLALTFGVLSILFQPFIKIVLGRGGWNLVDVGVAIFLYILWKKEMKK